MIDNYDHLRTGIASEAAIVKARLFIHHMDLTPAAASVNTEIYHGVLVEFPYGEVLFLGDGGVHLGIWSDINVALVCQYMSKVFNALYILS